MRYSSEREELLAQWKEELLREMRAYGINCDPALDFKEVQKVYEKNIWGAKTRHLNEEYGWKTFKVDQRDLDRVLADPSLHVRSVDRETGEVVARYQTGQDARAIERVAAGDS